MTDPVTPPGNEPPVNPELPVTPPTEPVPSPLTPPAEPVVPPASADPFYKTLPQDWREQAVESLGIEDATAKEKALKRLSRYKDFGTAMSAGLEAQRKVQEGEISTGLPESPTDEQLAAFREANDIPSTAEEYNIQLEDGLVLSDTDNEILKGVYEAAHGKNIPNGAVNDLVGSFLKGREVEAQRIATQDSMDTQEAAKVLRDNWGGDYDANINVLGSFVAKMPEDVRDAFKNARGGDGKGLLNNPALVNYLVDMERKVNPTALVVPNSANPAQTIKDEISSLEAQMGTPEWYKDEGKQKRLRDLYAADENLNKAA